MKLHPSIFVQTLRAVLLCLLLVAPVVGMCAETEVISSTRIAEIEPAGRTVKLISTVAPFLLGVLFAGISFLCMFLRKEKFKKSAGIDTGLVLGSVLLAIGVVANLVCRCMDGLDDLRNLNAAISGLLIAGIVSYFLFRK